MTNQLIPRLRFKQFNEQWNKNKLKDICIKIGDGLHGTPKYIKNGSISFINGNNFNNGFINTIHTKKVDYSQKSKDDLSLNESTILISINGTIGNLAYYKGENIKLGKSAAYININANKLDKHYLFMYLGLEKTVFYFKNFMTGTTIKNLGLKNLKNTPIKNPALPEQQQIGAFFTKLDHMIELQTQKISHLRRLKKGYLQKMFPQKGENVPRLRLKGFRDEWHKKKLKDICHSKSSKHSLKQSKKSQMGKYPIYDVNNIIGYINDFDQNTAYISIIKDGSGVGGTQIHFANSSIISTMNYILPNANINIYYLNLLLNTLNLLKYKIGTGIPHIYFNDYSNIGILIPNLQEQNKIGQFFKHLDQSITKQENKLIQLKQLKKGYLQKMFI